MFAAFGLDGYNVSLKRCERTTMAHNVEDGTVRQRVEQVIQQIRPAVQSDGGDIELVDVADGVVQIRFHGECVGCPSSSMTLQHGIERNVKARVPEVSSVVAVK
jgi:Fe-S cluster biogenesis protein NfuA